MELYIKVNGMGIKSKVSEFKYGQMVQDMKVIGLIIKLKEKVNFGM